MTRENEHPIWCRYVYSRKIVDRPSIFKHNELLEVDKSIVPLLGIQKRNHKDQVGITLKTCHLGETLVNL